MEVPHPHSLNEQERYANGNVPRELNASVLDTIARLEEERLCREALLLAIQAQKQAERGGDIWGA